MSCFQNAFAYLLAKTDKAILKTRLGWRIEFFTKENWNFTLRGSKSARFVGNQVIDRATQRAAQLLVRSCFFESFLVLESFGVLI